MDTARLAFLPAAALLGASAAAQVVVEPPNFQVDLIASGLEETAEDIAVDRFGNVYVLDQASLTQGSVTRIAPDGTVTPDHATGFGKMGQLAYDPTDGFVYLVDSNPILPVIFSRVWRIEPGGGATNVFGVDVTAEGFTIDDAGKLWLGGGGLQGAGLYSAEKPTDGGDAQAQLESTGFGQNAVLQSLATGDILIASSDEVRRFEPSTGQLAFYYDAGSPIPNQIRGVTSIARSPFNQLGVGAILGQRTFVTLCACGTGEAFFADPLGGLVPAPAVTFAAEEFDQPETGFRVLASGLQQDLYWYANTGPPVGGPFMPIPSRLYKITQLPAAGEQGSLVVTPGLTSVTWDLYGPTAGGDPLLLGVVFAPPAAPPYFFAPFGLIDLDPFGAGYIRLIDGIGLGVPPDPAGQTSAGGAFSLTLPIPPGAFGFSFESQGIVLSSDAPNGLYFLSNPAPFSIP